jgi:thiol-disulfide isomerase/thioredoxin
VQFSDFKGRIVLLNFWTTWCPGCVQEIPALIELQRRNAPRLMILGISLDGQTELDEHGHVAGTHSDSGHGQDKANGTVAEIGAKVEQFVKGNGVNYPVLLDPNNEVGRRFNGGELPTNVLIDSQGYVRRRFIGGRNVAAFEAMIDELASPKAER